MGNSGRFPQGSQLRQSRATQPTVRAGFLCFHKPKNSDMDYRIFNARKSVIFFFFFFCMHIQKRPRFIASSEGLLWGVESAETLTPGKLERKASSTKRSPIHVVARLDRAQPRFSRAGAPSVRYQLPLKTDFRFRG